MTARKTDRNDARSSAPNPGQRQRQQLKPDPTSTSTTSREERRQRAAAMQSAQRAKDRRRGLALWVSIAAVVVALAVAVTVVIVREQANRPTLEAVRSYTVSQGHVSTPVTYEQAPPAGGEHAPVWLNCGTYTEPVRKENAVHSMEHGAVWVTYRPDLPAAQVQALTAAMPDTYAVLSPYAGLKAPVVASAWGKQIELSGPEDGRLAAFIKAYRQGPQSPEPGASCTGGVDATGGAGMPNPGA